MAEMMGFHAFALELELFEILLAFLIKWTQNVDTFFLSSSYENKMSATLQSHQSRRFFIRFIISVIIFCQVYYMDTKYGHTNYEVYLVVTNDAGTRLSSLSMIKKCRDFCHQVHHVETICGHFFCQVHYVKALTLSHGAIFHATCDAILLLGDIKLENTCFHYSLLIYF